MDEKLRTEWHKALAYAKYVKEMGFELRVEGFEHRCCQMYFKQVWT